MNDDGNYLNKIIERLKSNRGVRILYIIQLVGLLFIILNPIGLPLVIDQYTRSIYNDINNLPDDSVVVIQAIGYIAILPELRPGSVAMLNLLLSKNIKIVIYCLAPEAPIYMPWILDAVKTSVMEENEYGVDYVLFGYVPGDESAQAAFASDMKSVYTKDLYGTPFDEIPMMKNINSAEDVDAVICISGVPTQDEAAIRQWVATYDMPYYAINSAASFASLQGYMPTQIRGMTNGVLGGAQLEILVGVPGEGAKTSDALSYVFILGVAAIISGNVYYYTRGRKR